MVLSRLDSEALIKLSLLNGLIQVILRDVIAFDRYEKDLLERSLKLNDKALDSLIKRFVTKESGKQLSEQIKNSRLFFLPEKEAEESFKTFAKDDDYCMMKNDYRDDLGERIIDDNCSKCKCEDYKNCPVRKLLLEGEFPPVGNESGCEFKI